jgi:hypothetical protein
MNDSSFGLFKFCHRGRQANGSGGNFIRTNSADLVFEVDNLAVTLCPHEGSWHISVFVWMTRRTTYRTRSGRCWSKTRVFCCAISRGARASQRRSAWTAAPCSRPLEYPALPLFPIPSCWTENRFFAGELFRYKLHD